jgi:hypothetical protein
MGVEPNDWLHGSQSGNGVKGPAWAMHHNPAVHVSDFVPVVVI